MNCAEISSDNSPSRGTRSIESCVVSVEHRAVDKVIELLEKTQKSNNDLTYVVDLSDKRD